MMRASTLRTESHPPEAIFLLGGQRGQFLIAVPHEPDGVDKKRVAGIVGLATGGLSIGIGAVLGGLAISRNNENHEHHCNRETACDDVGFKLQTEARSLANASTATFIVGGVLAATGVVLIAVSSPKTASSAEGKVTKIFPSKVWIGPTSIGVGYSW